MSQPALIIIGGFAGAGKTTVSNRLAGTYNYPVFSSDTINDALRASLNLPFKEASPIAYKIMWHLVRTQLQAGVTVIIDTHMAAAHIWESLDTLENEMPHITVLPLILQVPLETHRARIEERGRTNKEHLNLGGDTFEDVLFKYEFIESLQRQDLIRVNAEGSPDAVYESVNALINKHLPA